MRRNTLICLSFLALMICSSLGECSGITDPVTGADRSSTNYMIKDTLGQFVVGVSRQCAEDIDPIDCPYSCAILEHGFWHSDIHIPTISEIKQTPNGYWVEASAKAVTAGSDQFSKEFFITEGDRMNAIRVSLGNQGLTVQQNDVVDVAGIISGGPLDRVIMYPVVVTRFENAAQISPFFTPGRWLGGKGTDVGMPGGAGLLTTSLLMKTSGRVAYVDTAAPKKFFYVDDGSCLSDGEVIGGKTMQGLKVWISGLKTGNSIAAPGVNQYVTVTGICAPYSTAGKISVQIRPREQADIAIVAE